MLTSLKNIDVHIVQIVTGIEVNGELYLNYFPRLREYCLLPKCRRHAGDIPATDGNKAHH